jgi:hypothetical protein
MIIQTDSLESIRPLTADERLAAWAWKYLSAGYHHNPENCRASISRDRNSNGPVAASVPDDGRTDRR